MSAIDVKSFNHFKDNGDITIKQFLERLNVCMSDFTRDGVTADGHDMPTNINVAFCNEKNKSIKYGKIMDFFINRLPGCGCGYGLTIIVKEDE
jgi:hypothetical protein